MINTIVFNQVPNESALNMVLLGMLVLYGFKIFLIHFLLPRYSENKDGAVLKAFYYSGLIYVGMPLLTVLIAGFMPDRGSGFTSAMLSVVVSLFILLGVEYFIARKLSGAKHETIFPLILWSNLGSFLLGVGMFFIYSSLLK